MARQRPADSSRNAHRVSPLKGREWQGSKDHSAPLAKHLQHNVRQNIKGQGRREWQRQMETRPVAPSFLPTEPAAGPPNFPVQEPKSFQAESLDDKSSPTNHIKTGTPGSGSREAAHTLSRTLDSLLTDISTGPKPVAEKSGASHGFHSDSSIEVQMQELREQEDEEFFSQTLDASAQDWESELGLPSIQELEREQQVLQQKRQQEGVAVLRSLEQEAHGQEVERIRNSRIEVPNLELEKREGNSYLHVSRLHKRYGRKIAVEDISISLRQGEVVGLLGPNGAGKTTCFYMIAGFVHPTHGEVLYDEQNISRWPMFKRARQGISYLPQEASIFRSLTVEQNLLAILEYRRDMNRRARIKMAEFLMNRLGILRLRKQKASTLSGGERRRVEVARALTLEPRFLLLDEPFAGIDPIAVSEIKGIIRALAQSNIGILITDHNVRDTLDITDRSYIINLGEILVSGSRAELIASKAAREVYLGAEFS